MNTLLKIAVPVVGLMMVNAAQAETDLLKFDKTYFPGSSNAQATRVDAATSHSPAHISAAYNRHFIPANANFSQVANANMPKNMHHLIDR